jgi:hypothetical protein
MADKKVEDMTTDEFLKYMQEPVSKKKKGKEEPVIVRDTTNPVQAGNVLDAIKKRNKALKETLD